MGIQREADAYRMSFQQASTLLISVISAVIGAGALGYVHSARSLVVKDGNCPKKAYRYWKYLLRHRLFYVDIVEQWEDGCD